MIALLTLGAAVAQLSDNALVGTTTHNTCSPSNATACFDGGCASTGCILPEPQCNSGYRHTLQMVTLTAGECTAHTWTWRCTATTTTPTTTATTTATTTPSTTPTSTTTTTTKTETTTTTDTATTPKLLEAANGSNENKLAWYWILAIALATFIVLGCLYFACGFKAQNRRTHAMA